jgi:hypothetical protein
MECYIKIVKQILCLYSLNWIKIPFYNCVWEAMVGCLTLESKIEHRIVHFFKYLETDLCEIVKDMKGVSIIV